MVYTHIVRCFLHIHYIESTNFCLPDLLNISCNMSLYIRSKDLTLLLLFVALLQGFQLPVTDGASCSVTFYWKEVPAEMKSKERNWGKLEEKLTERKNPKLSDVMDVENAYAFKVEGDCCWEVYSEEEFEGDSVKLVPNLTSGFAGIPGFPKFKAKSLKRKSRKPC